MNKPDKLEQLEHSLQVCFGALAGEPSLCQNAREAIQELTPRIDRSRLAKEPDKVRGELDHFALKTRFHNSLQHQRESPVSPESAAVFHALERARYEALGMRMYLGVCENIDAMDETVHRQYSAEFSAGQANEGHLPEAARLLLREKLLARPVPKIAEAFLSPWREKLSLALQSWPGDQEVLCSQEKFAEWAREFLSRMEMSEATDVSDELQPDDAEDETEEAADTAEQEQEEQESDKSEQQMSPLDAEGEGDDTRQGEEVEGDFDDASGEMMPNDYVPPDLAGIDQGDYAVFTRQYDEVIEAEDLATPSELAALREELDAKVGKQHNLISRLANRLQRRLLAQQNRFWQFDLDQGVLDPARLARVVIDPQLPLSFKQEKHAPFRDTVVSLLIDNSGSMRGRPISIAAISVDILARTLERCGVSTEILGFTTRAWRGGQAKDAWICAGKPLGPGRLNELRHIIYKYADRPYRRIRNNLGLMLQEGLLKENIDGEALVWGYQRLLARPEERKILIVISDGAPVDDASLASNPSHILEQHLRTVITQIEAQNKVQLLAIGIGHDVTRYYNSSVMIRNVDELARVLLGELEGMMTENAPPSLMRRRA